jgi:hypothetical protein
MASIWKNFPGVVSSLFGIGGPSGNAIKKESYGLSVRNNDGTVLKNLGVAFARAGQDNDAAAYRDAKETSVLLEFSFHGSSAPSPGANSGAYGICHTSGGIYTAGSIYYDNGSTLSIITSYKGQRAMTKSTVSFSGTISMIGSGSYVAETNSAPYGWALKGDGGLTNTGYPQVIQVPIALASGVTSTTTLPTNSVVLDVALDITSAYTGGTTIEVSTTGGTPAVLLATTENDPTSVAIYEKDQDTVIGASNSGSVIVTITGSPLVGAGKVQVTYVQAFLG